MMVDSISQTLLNSFQSWMANHPILAWVMSYPLWAIALFLLGLLLCWGLLGAIARLIQQAWIFILQAPLKLLRLLFGSLFKTLHLDAVAKKPAEPDVQQRLLETLNRLEALRQEQEVLMQEVRTILLKNEVC